MQVPLNMKTKDRSGKTAEHDDDWPREGRTLVLGIGVDLVCVARVEKALRRRPAMRVRLFRTEELGDGDAEGEARSLAARFAAKEALRKALGGAARGGWRDVFVEGGRGSPPRLVLEGAWLQAAEARGAKTWHLSLSHEREYAIAMVVIEG
jgi:holo-[acyl-carrier protein] synthase